MRYRLTSSSRKLLEFDVKNGSKKIGEMKPIDDGKRHGWEAKRCLDDDAGPERDIFLTAELAIAWICGLDDEPNTVQIAVEIVKEAL